MKISQSSKKAVSPPPQVVELINKLINTPTDDLPQVLTEIDAWKWPRSDLNSWTKVLNKFDSVLEEIIRDYELDKLQLNVFTPITKKTVSAILRFERLLLENSTNRKMFNSYDRLHSLLFSSDLEIVILALNVLLRPAQQYSAQPSVSQSLSISTQRLQSLAKRWPSLREYGLGLVDLSSPKGSSEVNALPTEAREVIFSFYKTDAGLDYDKEKNMETDVLETPSSSARKVPVPPIPSVSGAINIHLDEQTLASKSVMDVLADTVEAYSVPDDEKFELMCRIRAAKVLASGQEADRVKLVIIRLLAIAIFGHTHPESEATSSLFLYEPDLIAHIAELLQVDKGVPVRVQTTAISALDSLAHYRNRNQEVLTAVNAGVNHGILMALVRRTVADVADPASTLPQSFIEALMSFVTFISTHASGGNMVVGAGLIPLLIQMIDNKLPNRLPVVSKTMQLVDNVLYSFTNAFNIFCTSHGVEALVNRIEYEVDVDINDYGGLADGANLYGSQGELPIARSAVLKHILRSMHRMMQSSGTAEGLRGLIDLSLLQSIKKIIQHRGIFGPNVLPLAINIMATFVHNEPTSLAIIQEAALPEAFYKAIEAGLEPSIEVLQAIPNALGALCLNDVGQTQLARRPSIIPGILSVFTSELHLKVLLDKENSVLLGTAIDELIRHHPSLRTAVFDALRATIAKIEELGSAYEVPEDLRHWYRLVPGPISTVVDGDVAMDVESVASAPRSDATVHAEDTQTDILDDDDVDEATNKIQDNHIVSFIDILGRFLEGLFQHTPHCKDFITHADGLIRLGRLTSLPCLPYDFANSVASDSMVQVMRAMTEVSTNETFHHLAQLVKESLEDTRSFWETPQEDSKLLPLVDTTGEQEEEANRIFRSLITLHIRITLLSDVFATAGYAHGRSAIGFLQSLMNNMSPQVIADLGSLHRVGVWENIVLNLGLQSKGISFKRPPGSSTFGRRSSTHRLSMNLPGDDSSINPNELNGDLNPPDSSEPMTTITSPSVPSKLNGRRERNSAGLKHLTHGLLSCLAPFFQAMVKMFHARRHPDSAQKKQINESSEILAKVMVQHLNPKTFHDVPSVFAYYSVILGLYSTMLVDERTSSHSIHTVQLLALYRAGGLDAILEVCRAFMRTVEAVTAITAEERSETQTKELSHAYGGLRVVLHLIRPIITAKPLLESGQTLLLATPDKKDTDPDYFEAHNFLVRLRVTILPLLQDLWQAPWLISAPLYISKSVVQVVLELTNEEGEDIRGGPPNIEGGSAPNNGPSRRPGPDEIQVQTLIDMGFPRSAAERALTRTSNNLSAATEILLSHPFPLPPDPDPEPEVIATEPPSQEHVVDADEAEVGPVQMEDVAPTPGESMTAEESSSPPTEIPVVAGKSAEQWRKQLDDAREPLRAGLSRQALLLIDEHVSLLFDLRAVFLRPNDAHLKQAVQDLVDDIKAFSPFAYDVQEQPLANRCRLIALVLSESPSLFSQEMRSTLMDGLLALLLSSIDPEHPPRWLATHLLVTEALFTLAAEPRAITVPKEGELIVAEAITVGPPLKEAKAIVFDFCLRLLAVPDLPSDEWLSILRLFVLLTRDYEMALQFMKSDGLSMLLSRVKASAVPGSSTYIAIILRHIVEDPLTLRNIMQHTIKRYFDQPRTRSVDIGTYVRNCNSLALRNPDIFLEVTGSLCQLGEPYSSPHISLKAHSPVADGQPAQKSEAEGTSDMQVDEPSATIPGAAVESTIFQLINELMSTMKIIVETPSPPRPAAEGQFRLPASNAGTSDGIAPDVGDSAVPASPTILYDYGCFLMQCLTELLFSYDSCKFAFLSYSPKKRGQTPSKETSSKYRTATLQFLLSDLVTFGTINPQPDDRARNRITLCNWAMSVLVALCVDSAPNHEVKEVSADLVSVRKFVLEAVSRAIKDLPPSDNLEARYGRLLALADLCHRLLIVRFNATSNKQQDENPTHIAKIMLEKNFVSTLTTALSEIDLNYPHVRGLVPSVLRPLQYLTKIAIKMSRSSAKSSKDAAGGAKAESAPSSDSEDDEDLEDTGREETPDLYRNSALGMYGGEMDDAHFGRDEDMDEDEEDEDEDVEMDFGEDTASDATSDTEDDGEEDGLDNETHESTDAWDEGDDEDDDLIENDDEEGLDDGEDRGIPDEGDDDDGEEDMMWQDVRGEIDGVRLGDDDMDDDDGHPVPIQIIHEDDEEPEDVGSDEEDYVLDNGGPSEEQAFGFSDAFLSTNNREGAGVFVHRRRGGADDGAVQVFGRSGNNPATPPEATTHPLLLDTSASRNRSPSNQPRAPRQIQRVSGNGTAELLQTIDDLMGGGAIQLFQQLMTRGRGGGPETIRLDVPTGAVVNLERAYVGQRRHGVYAASVRVERAPTPHDDRTGRELEPIPTAQRWVQEARVLHGEFVTERLNKFTNHVILALLPAAVEASKQAKIQEEQEKAIRQEALAKEEAEAAEEKINAEQADKEEADQAVTQEAEVADARQVGLASSVVPASEDQAMEDAVPLPAEADSDMTDATTLEPVNAEPHHESTTESPEISGESSSAPTAPPERVTVMIHGSPVDITETGIDPTFLEALPDDMREEVLNQHVRDQRAARIERPPDSQISSEFLDALPPEIRAEIIQQEAVQRAQARPGAGAEMDNATFLASLDPTLRQTVLMEQDEGFIQTLPSHMLAEVGTYREGQQPQRASHRSIPVPGSVASRKFTPQHDAIQLLDKSGVAVLVRLLFFPHVLKKTLLFKVLVNLCENAKTRTELFNLLLNILQDGTGDLAAVDKSFAQMSFRNSKPPTSKALGKQKAGPEYLPGLALPSSQNEAVPDLIAQRCLEALTYIVSSNEMSSLFFLTEHELPAGLRRTASKKGKGKEKQIPQTHYPIVLLLSLLDRQSLLRTPAIMESVVGLLATVTRPLASLKDRKDPVESDASTPNLPAPEPPSGAPESLEAPMDTVSTVETLSASISDSPPAPSEPTPPTAEVPTGESPITSRKDQDLSIEAVEEKILLANTPQIPHAVLRLIVNILTVGECSGRTFQQSLALIQHLSHVPDARDIIAQELKLKAQEFGQSLSSDLDELAIALKEAQGDLLVSSVASKFSPASSVQAKLLRVLKTIDYMYSPKTPALPDTPDSEDVQKVQSIYESFQFAGLWRRLGGCLAVIEEKPATEHVATVLLPLIEALMVVCKYVGAKGITSAAARALRASASPRSPATSRESMEELFVTFTDAHRKILNLMVRNNPSLMSGSFSLLVHNPRVLDFDNKRNYFNQQLHRRPQTREHHSTLQLNVRRARVFEDSFQYLQRKTGEQIKHGKLSVRFYDEEGVDAGGVTREWFQILARQMFDPNNALFQPCAADKLTYQPNKNSWVNPEHLTFFKFVGRVIGKAIYDGRLLDAYFARSLYRQLLGKPVDYKDVEWVDPEYYNSLCWILENDPTPLELTFSVEADEFGINRIVSLKEGGEHLPVTQENKREFVQLSAQYRLYSSIKDQIESLSGGFYEIVPKDLIAIFNEQELELLISGTPDIDVDEWRAATEYNGYSSSDPNIVWWWRALKSFNRDERAKLLSFATGTSRVPLGGFVELQGVQGVQRFSIHKAYGASDRLPQAHTCFNQIDLPPYTSYEMLRQQLLLAINEGGEGFAFS